MLLQFRVEHGDVLDYPADLLVLKYAQEFLGADSAVIARLAYARAADPNGFDLRPGETRLIDTHGAIGARRVLFVGTRPIHELDYGELRGLAASAIQVAAQQNIPVATLAYTLHGPGFGLDEVESLLAIVGGANEGLASYGPVRTLRRVVVVEKDPDRVRRLDHALGMELDPASDAPLQWDPGDALDGPASRETARPAVPRRTRPSESKDRAFVAMPFADDFEDLFHFGIQDPIRSVGLVCERMDREAFVGDIVGVIKQRITRARLVIGVLTSANPNVYLELGYAWGVGTPTVLVIHDGEAPLFDVVGQRCLRYKNLVDLNKTLTEELSRLIS